MDNPLDNLSEFLDIPEELRAPTKALTVPTESLPAPTEALQGEVVIDDADIQAKHDRELDDDLQLVRTNLKTIAEDASSAMKTLILLADSSDSPKSYESVAKLVESIVTANRELVEIHRIRKETLHRKPVKSSLVPNGDQRPMNIKNAIFVGRASDLLRELRDIQKTQTALPAPAGDAETS